jgi:uncharacterized phosphosugar-binding protein
MTNANILIVDDDNDFVDLLTLYMGVALLTIHTTAANSIGIRTSGRKANCGLVIIAITRLPIIQKWRSDHNAEHHLDSLLNLGYVIRKAGDELPGLQLIEIAE